MLKLILYLIGIIICSITLFYINKYMKNHNISYKDNYKNYKTIKVGKHKIYSEHKH